MAMGRAGDRKPGAQATGKPDDAAEREGAADAARPLSSEELEALEGTELPERAAMSTVAPDVTVPIDPSIVADVLAGGEPPESTESEPGTAAAADDDPERPERE